MRKFWTILTLALVLAGSGLMTVSCIDDIFGSQKPGINRPDGGHNGTGSGTRPGGGTTGGTTPGGGSGDSGTTPGGGDQQTSIFPGDKKYKIKADAVYYGSQNYKNCDEYVLYLYWGEYDEDGSFKDEGTELAFDIICKTGYSMSIPEGSYSCTSDNITPGHFLDGYEENGQIYPSYAYYQKSKQNSKTVKITSGNITVSRSGDSYKLRVFFGAVQPNGYSTTSYLVLYEGDIEIVDGRKDSDGGSKVVEMNKFSSVEAEYWGQIWNDKDGRVLPVSDWILYLYGENAAKDSEYTMIEVLTPADSKSLEPGIYNEVIGLDDTRLFKPGAVISGYSEPETNIAYGTWYCKGGNAVFAATKGQVSVASKNDLYSLTFDFIDEDETYGGQFKGSYTGQIKFIDKSTAATKAGESRGRLQKNIQRNSAPARNVQAARRISE